jgi:pSer/pThr/pTyr-binding forkhead associated (FHA) protein
MVAATPSGSGFREVASLDLIKGDCAPSKIWLKAGKNTIGRSAASSASMHQLQTSDTNIGRNHACIECVLRGDGSFEYSISDLNSKNGTYRNGERLKEGDNLILQLNDKIGLGSQTIFQITMGG